MKRKSISLIIVFTLIVTMLFGETCQIFAGTDTQTTAVVEYNGEPIIHGTTTYFANMGKAKDVDYYYSDGYFKANPEFDNSHLKTASMAFAMSTMNNNDGAYAKSFLETIDCKNLQKIGYGETPTENTVAAYYGSKKVFAGTKEECILVPVVLRSAFYGEEWVNNFVVGESGDANGFASSASKVYTAVDSYIQKVKGDSDVKIWIAGYSRGGSIANLVGKSLSDEYGKENVYGYSFESQMATIDKTNAANYTNLRVINNYSDLLTLLYPNYMGFGFNGKEEQIATLDDLANKEESMKTQLAKINTAVDEYKNPKNIVGYKLNSKIVNLNIAGLFLDALFGGEIEFVQKAQSTISQRAYGNLLIERISNKALITRKDYVSNEGRTVKNSSSINVNDARIDGIDVCTVEGASKIIVKLVVADGNDKLIETIKNFPVKNFVISNANKVDAVLGFLTKLDLSSWQGNNDTERFSSLVNYLWNVLDNSQGDNYPGLSGLKNSGDLSQTEYNNLKSAFPILVYTLGALTSQDIGQTNEALTTILENFDSIAQAHYPEINISWLMTKDSYYTGGAEDHTHTFDQTSTDTKYLKQDATCTKKAVYYKSCKCGEKGEATFEYGNALGHNLKSQISSGRTIKSCSRCTYKDYILNTKYVSKISKLTKGKKCLTVKWKKQSSKNQKKFSGYQIQYSIKSDMSGAKTTTAKKSAKSKKISKLTSKKTYFVRMRSYYKYGGHTYYSGWTSKKSIKVK